jgi:hypothetical protein
MNSIERENSAEALASVDAETDRAAVLAVIARSPAPVGPSEIALILSRSILSIRPRVSNLKVDGIIESVGRRPLPNGTHEAVYRVAHAQPVFDDRGQGLFFEGGR